MSSENDPSPPQPTHLPCSFLPQVRQYLGAKKGSRSSTTSYLCHPQSFVQSADPCLGQGRGGAWDHRRACKTAVCPPSNSSNPSASLSKATLAASRKPFQGNSRSYRPQTMLQTLPQAFPGQLSAPGPSHLLLKAFKTAACPPSNPQTLPQAFPRQLLQLPASLSRSYTLQTMLQTLPQAFPRQLSQLQAPAISFLRDSRLPFARPQTPQTPQTLLQTFLATSRKPFHRSYTPQTMLQTLPQAFPRQLSQLPAGLSKTAVCPPSNQTLPQAFSKATRAASRRPFQGNSRSYTPQTMLQILLQAFPRQLSQLHAPAISF